MKISTSFLSCKNIEKDIKRLNLTDTDYLHVDFIDGSFVDGKEIPFRKLKKIPKITAKRLDVHLMTTKLDKYIKKFSILNCEYITFHFEATKKPEKYISIIHSYGIKCGIAINPKTDIETIKPILDMADLVLVMSVEPGYGGQAFIEDTISKLEGLRNYIKKEELNLILSVDGGINNETIEKVKPYVDMVVSGSYITSADSFQEKINSLR